MITIKAAGVPEHFMMPFHLCLENNEFKNKGIDLKWRDTPEGTGKLCEMLRTGETDIAFLLTEGIIKDIITNDNPSKIIQTYVESPLLWGIHVDSNSKYTTLSDLSEGNKTVAISRYGSGSHLMAYVNAEYQGWNSSSLQFRVVNTITGAVEALNKDHTADYFMWEHFMTKPLVDNGTFRRLSDCPSPWPCFVIASRKEILESHSDIIQTILKIINEKTKTFKAIPNISKVLSERYHQKEEDIIEWLSLTEWSQKQLSKKTVDLVQKKLFDLKIIDKKLDYKFII